MPVTNTVGPQITTTFPMDKIKSPKKFDLENGNYSPIKQLEELRTFAPKNFPHTDIFKTLTDGRK